MEIIVGHIKTVISIATGLLGIGLLITFHEFGHFLFCKIFNVQTPSFSIGFGPRLISKKIGETEFKISAIPLGGYVEMAGSAEIGQGEQKLASSEDDRSFASKPFYQKLLIMFGGILFNLLFAYIAIALVLFFGAPKSRFLYPANATTSIQEVRPKTPAAESGLKSGDRIIKINDTTFEQNQATDLIKALQGMPGSKATLYIERDGKRKTISTTIGQQTVMGKEYGMLGVNFEMVAQKAQPILTAISNSIKMTNNVVKNTFMAFASIFSRASVKNLSGPVMIIRETARGASEGIKIFLLLLALISVNLAVLNCIPLPILDGGQILFYTIEAVIGRPLPERIRETIHIVSWVGMMILALYLVVQDTARIVENPWLVKAFKWIGMK